MSPTRSRSQTLPSSASLPKTTATAPGNGAEGGELDMLAAYKAALDRIADDDLDFG